MANRYDSEARTAIPGSDSARHLAWSAAPSLLNDLAGLETVLAARGSLTVPIERDSEQWATRVGLEHRPLDAQGNVGYLKISRGAPGELDTYSYTYYAYYDPTVKKGFLGGLFGGGAGGILGGIFLAPLCGPGAPACAAAMVAAGAAGGTLVGGGAESLISGTEFGLDNLKQAAIAGAVAGVGSGVASALGPSVSSGSAAAGGAAQEAAGQAIVASARAAGEAGGFVANLSQEALGAAIVEGTSGFTASLTQPGIVSANAAKAIGGLSTTLTRTALAPFAVTSASLGDTFTPTSRTSAQAVPISGGAINTTGATWINYSNPVDVPVAQPVGFFDSMLDFILPPFMHPDDLGKTDTPGDTRNFTPDSGGGCCGGKGVLIVAVLFIIGGAAFAYSRR